MSCPLSNIQPQIAKSVSANIAASNAPDVSIIMPVYNCEQYLPQAVEALQTQTLEKFELIIVDDGSSDDTLRLACSYAEVDPRTRVLQQDHGYAGVARNLGMSCVRGSYLMFLDGDDFFDPVLLEHTLARARETDADIVAFKAKSYNSQTGRTRVLEHSCNSLICPSSGVFNRDTNTANLFCFTTPAPWTKLYRTEFVRQHGLRFQSTRSANDFCFVFSSLALANRIAVLDEALVTYRQNNETSLQATQHRDPFAFFEALRGLKKALQGYGLWDQLEHPFENLALDFCMYNLRTLAKYPESQEQVFDFLKNEGLAEMGIAGKPRGYFYVYPKMRYDDLLLVQSSSYEQYVIEVQAQQARSRTLPARAKRWLKRKLK